MELAQIFLVEILLAAGFEFFIQERLRNSGALGCRNGEAGPAIAAVYPFVVEKTLFAVWRAGQPQVASADGEHGAQGKIQAVADLSGLIDDEERERGKASYLAFELSGECDDPRTVLEF